jgi:hypothetical protein
MNYQLKMITILKGSHLQLEPGLIEEEVQATIAEGTGLAYHRASRGGYTITHLASGYCLSGTEADDEATTRLWLEEVAPMTDWTADSARIQADLIKKYKTPNLHKLIADALKRAKDRARELAQA